MKITVTAARRDDILKRKAEYEQQFQVKKARHDEQYGQYKTALHQVFAEVEDAVRSALGDSLGELQIKVDTRYDEGLQVEIKNSSGGPRRSADAALTWSWSASLMKDGSISKESGSWSGLEAVTPAQIDDLKLTVRQLEIINSMDWEAILSKTVPNWEDYVTEPDPSWDRDKPNFDRELMEADIEDAVGANVLIKAHEGRAYRGDVYFHILRDSGSQYAVEEVPAYAVDSILEGKPAGGYSTIEDLVNGYANTIRIRKTNFFNMIYTPLQTQNY